jgi:hypothetical protein
MAMTTDRIVAHHVRDLHGLHAEVVHAGHAQADDDPAGQQRAESLAAAEAHDEQADRHHRDRHQHADDGQRHVVADGLTGDGEAEHRDEVHGPDAGGPDGDGRQRKPQRPAAAAVGSGPGQAAQPDERAQARHQVAQHRVDQAIRKILNMHDRHVGPPMVIKTTGKITRLCPGM